MRRQNEALAIAQFDPHGDGVMCRYVVRIDLNNTISQACPVWFEDKVSLPPEAEDCLAKNSCDDLVSRLKSVRNSLSLYGHRQIIDKG